MLRIGWLALRQVQEALRGGRLEEAQRLLEDDSLVQGHKKCWELKQELARAFAQRGEQRLRRRDVAGAWSELARAEQVGVTETAAAQLRQALERHGLGEVRGFLEQGEPDRAAEAIVQFRGQGVRQADAAKLEEAARDWVLAREQADRGEFALALNTIQRVERLLPMALAALQKFRAALEERRQAFTDLSVKLHEAARNERWDDVLQASEKLLALAPQHPEARRVRGRAWRAIEPPTIASAPAQRIQEVATATPGEQYLLWIDGVGGYLVCMGSRVTIGQATSESHVDVPVFADVSRLHAAIARDTEGYVLEGLRPIQVNGKALAKSLLRSGDRFTLGASCQFQFRQPVPISASARLDLASGHRLRLAVDGILLMADTLVFGPGAHVHVALPDVTEPVILYRQQHGGLGIRHAGNLTVNGRPYRDRAALEPGATVVGDEFALTLEPVNRG
jgi:tetratricopeptide (TPR) repeat protein